MIDMGTPIEPQLRGSLQKRREISPGQSTIGYECTIAVRMSIPQPPGGDQRQKVIMKRVTIAGVGHLIFFEDPEGNVAGAMQYDVSAQ
jgi:hypothetical protein